MGCRVFYIIIIFGHIRFMRNDYDIIVVGAGLAGLACALRCCEQGRRVLIIEAHPYAGGRTSSFDDNGMQVESGLHRFIGYYSALPRLLRDCGVNLSDILTWEDKADVRINGEKTGLILGVAPLLGFGKTLKSVFGNTSLLSVRDKLSLVPFFMNGLTSYLTSRDLDGYTVTEYAKKYGVTENARHLVLTPLSAGIFFLNADEYSAYPFFGLFAPGIPKFYKMRIGAFLGGMTEVMCEPVVRRISALGGQFRFNERVKRVTVERGAVTGVECESGEVYRAPRTVVATHLSGAKKVLQPLRGRRELYKLFKLPCMSACTVQFELKEPALSEDVTTFGVGCDVVSFAEQSRSTFQRSAGRLSVILGNADRYVDMATEELTECVCAQLKGLGVDITGKIMDVRKVSEEDEFYSLRCGSQRLRPTQRTGVRGLVLAGDYTLTKSFATMEGAVLSGEAAAGECISNFI